MLLKYKCLFFSKFFRLFLVTCDYDDEAETPELEMARVREPEIIKAKLETEDISLNNSASSLKETFSQAMLHSELYQSLPKYIFQSEHKPLERVKKVYEETRVQQQRELDMDSSMGDCELSEYPIEHIEQQEHALQRQLSIK